MGSVEAPLLLPAPEVEGCPGCAMDRRKAQSNGRIPYKEFFFVGITTLASSLPITCLFPFMYFMIRDFNITKTEEDIGFYAGFLAASYMVGRGFAAVFWGIVADRIGRKPVIAFSILSVPTVLKSVRLNTKHLDSQSSTRHGVWVLLLVQLLEATLHSLHDGAYSEILSLWAVSDRNYGGLSFSSEDIGQVLAMADYYHHRN
ncbi:hypothetical protein QOZ80_9AG0673630 [Eleusine coracana subsp. coracana]|nr:hypothetical protein QOZ80_9AG0673630 [Eleusine coracana subsp. coracana]